MATTLGVATFAYAPYAFLNLLNPLIAILYGYTGWTLKKLDDEVLRRRRFTSAFDDTRFKRPRLDLGGTFSPAVELDPPAEGPRKGST